MNEFNQEQSCLVQAWENIFEGTGKAIEWVQDVAQNSTAIEKKSQHLVRQLYKTRNLARNLRRVATTPMGVGFFGLSQAGKSHLINTLAANGQGKLLSDFGQQKLSFEDHVNPQGGGAEATGLVTRFTRRAAPSPDPRYPVELRLFREIELAMVLVNAWFEEFDHDSETMGTYAINASAVNQALDTAMQSAEKNPTSEPSVLSEDVAALHEYVDSHYYGKTQSLRQNAYWPRAIALAPRLSLQGRAQLFSVLWAGVPQITEAYTRLAEALEHLGRAEVVFASIDALVTLRDGTWLRENSIMSVNTLHLLSDPSAPLIAVSPYRGDKLQAPVNLSVAEITALTSELVFRLVEEPKNPVVNQIDLLDFPGYRTRSKMQGLTTLGDKGNSISNLLLRGKVAYLFERYTQAQEMNALVLCTSSFKQSEVVGVEKVLKTWIATTQGATPQERASHAPGLIWVLTMCDGFAQTAIDGAETGYSEACRNMMKLTMLERFGGEEWMQAWAPNQPFNNTFLTRAPQFTGFTQKQKDNRYQEEALDPEKASKLEKLGLILAQTESCQRHINQPTQAWEAMLTLNDGGIQRFSTSLEPISDVAFKLTRIRQQLASIEQDVLKHLTPFYEVGGEAEREKQKKIANQIVRPFCTGKVKYVIGELLAAMCVPPKELRDLYLYGDFESMQEQAQTKNEQTSSTSSITNDDFDIFSEPVQETAQESTQASTQPPQWKTREHLFARAAMDIWIKHLRQLPQRTALLQWLGLPQETISSLVNELIRAAERQNLDQQLSSALLKREYSGVRREKLVDRHVLTARVLLDDFAAWFGCMQLPEQERPVGLLGTRKPLFSYLPIQTPEILPKLPEQMCDYPAQYADDWVSAVAINTQNNTGHQKGREITPEQNEALGKVLALLEIGMQQGKSA